MSKFVRPDLRVLLLPDGDSITVKRRLNTGEQLDAYARMYFAGPDGKFTTSSFHAGLGHVLAFLVDWTLTDDDGALVPIRGVSRDELESTLRSLDPDAFRDIKAAIERHEAEMTEQREQEKKRRDGLRNAGPISPSPSAADGASSGSAHSIPMITPPSSIS